MYLHHLQGFFSYVCWSYKIKTITLKYLHRWLLQIINRLLSLQNCKIYQVVTNAGHIILLRWWLHIQSIKSWSVYLVGEFPMLGACSVRVWLVESSFWFTLLNSGICSIPRWPNFQLNSLTCKYPNNLFENVNLLWLINTLP